MTAEQERLLQLWRDALETLVSWLDTERDALTIAKKERDDG